MKICVYAIAKNEAKHAARWVASMGEADYVRVLDTGSTDGTPAILRGLGVVVKEREYQDFDFAQARNDSMALIPEDADICVCTDLDEVFPQGWAEIVRKSFALVPDATNAACKFITKFSRDGKPQDVMNYWKIHKRGVAHWSGICHEYLVWDVPQKHIWIDGLHLEHHPDDGKSRAQYLELLIKDYERTHSPRSQYYLGREYMFHKDFANAVKCFLEYINNPAATWKTERAWAYRYLGRCSYWLGQKEHAYYYFWKGIAEAPEQRESACDLADLALLVKDYPMCVQAARIAVGRKKRDEGFFTEEDAWTDKPWNLLSLGYYHLGDAANAIIAAKMALQYKPDDERIKGNISFFERELKK